MKKAIFFLVLLTLGGCARRPVTNPRTIDGRPGAQIPKPSHPAATAHVIG
ncbi:hypothetical protein [Tellurirhabdus rosea]|nr:hypothetical protein [Tellurirhabdus rosea]